MADVVETFLQCRRDGDVECAMSHLAPNTIVSFPYGGSRNGDHIQEYLTNERDFIYKGFLNKSIPVKEIGTDGNTFTRYFKFNSGSTALGNTGVPGLTWLTGGFFVQPFREVYLLDKNNKIAHISCNVARHPRKFWARVYEHYFNPIPHIYQKE